MSSLPARVGAGELVVLRPSRGRKLGVAVLGLWALFMAATGLLALLQGSPGALVLLVPASALALCWLTAAAPASSALTIDRGGFTARHCFISRHWSWSSVSGFGIRTMDHYRAAPITLVSFTSRDLQARAGGLLERLGVRGLTRTTTLPDRYGEEAIELAAGMESCRALFGGAGSVSKRATAGKGKTGRGLPAVVAANDEIASVAVRTSLAAATVNTVLEAHYDHLAQHPGKEIDERRESARIADVTSVDAETVARVLAAQLDYLDGLGLVGG